jgi:CheY-like chemotaxis protein
LSDQWAKAGVAVFSSENRADVPIYPGDVFVLTDAGKAEIHGGSTRLPADALEVLVMLDGRKTVGDLEQAVPHLQPADLRNVLRALIAAHLVRAPTMDEEGTLNIDFAAFLKAAGDEEPLSPAVEKSADREAVDGAPMLERNGYYVSIARHALKARPPSSGKLLALVIEDDPDMAALIGHLLGRDIFAVSVCSNREQVLARLRQKPLPDVVMLDVQLPDVNGFDIVHKLKTHPQLKMMPVIIVTADSRPESVMRGLALGADGYVTKPFDHATLVKGVKAVMGL